MVKLFNSVSLEDNDTDTDIVLQHNGHDSQTDSLLSNGLMDENDVDFLNHLSIVNDQETQVAIEGVVSAQLSNIGSVYTDAFRDLKGWFLGVETKRMYIEEICDDLLQWCKEQDVKNPELSLKMGAFKTWMKTSEVAWWRYFFLLDDKTFNEMMKNIKNDSYTEIEKIDYDRRVDEVVKINPLTRLAWFVGHTFNQQDAKKRASLLIDNAKNIKELIKIIELYKSRSNEFFKAITDRKKKIPGTPFQMILLGATDLRRAVKKTVNLAT